MSSSLDTDIQSDDTSKMVQNGYVMVKSSTIYSESCYFSEFNLGF